VCSRPFAREKVVRVGAHDTAFPTVINLYRIQMFPIPDALGGFSEHRL
jgi:hypothetical protein